LVFGFSPNVSKPWDHSWMYQSDRPTACVSRAGTKRHFSWEGFGQDTRAEHAPLVNVGTITELCRHNCGSTIGCRPARTMKGLREKLATAMRPDFGGVPAAMTPKTERITPGAFIGESSSAASLWATPPAPKTTRGESPSTAPRPSTAKEQDRLVKRRRAIHLAP